jgi:transposase InsO family protein
LKSKDEAATKVKQYLTLIERQDENLPKAVRTDNGREYVNKDLIGWCLDKGIELQTTAPHTPEQNGIAERWNRTVVKLGRAMLLANNLPSELWAEAMTHTIYIRNCAFTCAIPEMTPYQKWFARRPDISNIQEFGQIVWVLNEELNPSKLDAHAGKHIFVRHEDGPNGIRYYDPTKRTIKVTRNYRFPLTKHPDPAPDHRFEGEKQHLDKPSSGPNKEDHAHNKQKRTIEDKNCINNKGEQRDRLVKEPIQ